MTPHEATRRKVTLFRGVYPLDVAISDAGNHVEVNRQTVDELLERGLADKGDLVIITKGDLMGVLGGTNTMKIVRAGE